MKPTDEKVIEEIRDILHSDKGSDELIDWLYDDKYSNEDSIESDFDDLLDQIDNILNTKIECNTENEGYIRGLNAAVGILKHSKDMNQADNSLRNAIVQAELLK